MGDLMPKDERLLKGFVVGPPITDEEAAKLVIAVSGSTVTTEEIVKAKDALALIRQTDASYRQLSKALCGKENATLEELLHGASQVKAELQKVKRERVALERDFKSFVNCTHNVCHYCASNSDFDCGKCWYRYPEAFVWRGVCPENTEVKPND